MACPATGLRRSRSGVLPSLSLACGSPGGLEELLGARPALATVLLPRVTSGLRRLCDPGMRDGAAWEMRTTCPGVGEAGGR